MGFFIPIAAGVMGLDDPKDLIEEHKDFWFPSGNGVAIEPMLGDQGMMIEHVLAYTE
jgi:hypothetical protein